MKRRWTCGVIAAIILALLIGLVAGTYLGWDRQFLSRYVPWLPYSPKAPTATGQPGPLHMTFTEADLTQQLHKSMHGQADGLSIHLQPGLIILSGEAHDGGMTTQVRAELVPFPDAGRIGLRMNSVKIGKLPLPTEAGQILANHAARALYLEQSKVPGLVVDTVTVTLGQLALTGHIDKSKIHPSQQNIPR